MGNLRASLLLALGYLAFYAGIAGGGEYALEPWKALSQ